MRNVAAVFAAVLLSSAAYAADVVINQPHVAFFSETGVSVACKGLNRRGCTTLMTEFVCACNRTAEDRWTLNPRLIVTPYVYTTTQSVVGHELSHIADIRGSLKEYAASLTLHVFQSEASCLSFIVDEKKLFPSTMRNIQRLTTIRRDGVRYAQQQEAGDH